METNQNHSITQNLLTKHASSTGKRRNFFSSAFRPLRRLFSGKKVDGGTRTEEEENVYTWLYALAQSERDMVFEYVRSTERGLSFKEADRRLKESGPSAPLSYNFPSWWKLLWNASFCPFNVILVVLSVVSFITRDYRNSYMMLTWVIISIALRCFKECSSSKAAMRLSELLKFPVKVQRCAGRVVQTELIVQVDQRDIVPGDIVIFGPGDLFPGDVRLLKSKDLIVSQSSLTGESGTTEKTADIREDQATPLLDLKNICFMGTSVISGSGTALVASTGSKTYVSTLFSTIRRQKPPDDFHRGVRHVSYALICVMLVVVPAMVLINYWVFHELTDGLLFGISVAVVLTPQMLPLIVNMNLARGALAMAREKCIVKSLDSIQNMGAMDILCIDKTGTLTMDQVVMVHHLDSWGIPKERVLLFGFLNSCFKTNLKNPVDDAILIHVYSNGYRFLPSKWRKIDEIPFDYARRRVSVFIETDMNQNGISSPSIRSNRLVVTKGALEEVVKICTFVEQVDSGALLPLCLEECQRILRMGEELSNDGLRVIGVAMRALEMESIAGSTVSTLSGESNMVFLGVLTFFDPPKDSAKEALWRMAAKGVEAKVLTGDSLSLAIKVCKEVGVKTTDVITGPDLELLEQNAFHETVKRVTVMARLTPTQKLRVVQSLQTIGNHVVGFLGDGINDCLALDASDVGIAVDSGASVVKDLADIILLEKDLNVLVAGVEQGRFTYGNTMKYLKSAVIANVGTVVSLFIATLLLPFVPLTPTQLLMQNFLYNVGQIVIPWDKMEEEYANKPHRWSPRELPLFMLWNGPVCVICDIGAFLFLQYYYKVNSESQSKFFQSAWFIEGLLIQTLTIHMIRTVKVPFFQNAASWPVICFTVAISAIGIASPFTRFGKVMGMTDLPFSYFAFLIILFIGYFTLGQLVKTVYILVYRRWL